MVTQTNHAAIAAWIAVILVVIGLIGGYLYMNGLSSNVADAKASSDAAIKAVNNAVNSMPTASQIASQIVVPAAPVNPSQNLDIGASGGIAVNGQYTCRNRYYPNSNDYAEFIVGKLDENTYRLLYNRIRDAMNIAQKSDIISVSINELGQCKTNQDPSRGLTSGRFTQEQFTIDVQFYKDGNYGDLYQHRFVVTGTVGNMGDGLDSADLEAVNVSPVVNSYSLP